MLCSMVVRTDEKSPYGMMCQDRGVQSEIFEMLLIFNACAPLNYMEMCFAIINKLNIHPIGMATLKKAMLTTGFKHVFSSCFLVAQNDKSPKQIKVA